MLTFQDISFWSISEKANGRKVVATNGCFDILHAGHVDYLRQAWMLGDSLVVGLNNDASIRKLKGAGRPINTLVDRAKVLSALRYVSQVVPFGGKTAIRFLKAVKPDLWVKGGDYTLDTLDQQERQLVEGYGGKIVLIRTTHVISTSAILDKIKAQGEM